MGKAKSTTIGYKYFLGLHMGLCRGQIDALLEIKAGDRTAWSGWLSSNTEFGIHKPDLFGGTKAEGGIDGTAWLMLGGPDQTVPDKIKGWLGGLVPGFRGTTTLFFDGMVSAMSPYPKAWKMKAFRAHAGWDGPVWYSNKVQIDIPVLNKDGDTLIINCMNPAHVVYQTCTDRPWGRGMPREVMDDAAFRRAADTLFEEGFGLCLPWKRQDTLDSFVQTVLDHIGAVIYVDKRTGLFTIKLIRQDYVRSQLPLFDMDSGLLAITESSISSGSETVNEVVVNWHDPITNQDSAVREQNLASIQSSGAVFSTTNDYPGLPTPGLAQRVAKRDLIYSTLPLRTFQLTCDRRAWRIQPGDVMRIQDITRGQIDIVVRVGTVDDGTLTDGQIKIGAVEDVFTMPLNATVGVEPGYWQPPDVKPQIARRKAYEIPYANLNRLYPKAEFAAIEFDAGFYGMAAEKPTPASMGYDLALRPNGGSWVDDGTGDFVPLGELTGTINYLDTEITLYKGSELDDIEFPCAAYIGEEIVMIKNVTLGGSSEEAVLTVERGIYDTIPARHFGGDICWFYEDSIGSNYTEYVGGDVIDGKELPWTFSGGRLPLNDAPIDTVKMNWRFSRPYAPGHVMLNSTARWYQSQVMNRNQPALNISWTHRDRPAQSDQMISHEVGNIGPERGSTYTARVYNDKGDLIRDESGINGTSWNYLWSQAMSDLGLTPENAGKDYSIVIRLWTRRDDLDSWQYYEMNVVIQDVAFYFEAAQYAAQSMQETDAENVEGVTVATYAARSMQESDTDNVGGMMVAQYAAVVEQLTVMPEVIDYQVMEAPYISLLHDALPTDASRVLSMAARPSDRLTDGHSLWTTETEAQYNEKGEITGYKEKGDYHDAGSQPWSPWVLLSEPLQHLTTEMPYSDTSVEDGVALNFQVGDLALIDKEIVRIDGIQAGKLIIGRGVADTVPARHGAGTPVWLFDRAHGIDNVTYGDEDSVGVKIQPHSHTPLAMDLANINKTDILMSYRYKRPYAPGLLLIDGRHWFEDKLEAFTKDAEGLSHGKPLLFTWKHRNRFSQAGTPIDHWHDNIGPEPGVKYLIRVAFTPPAVGGQKAKQVVLREVYVEGTEWLYRADWAEQDGAVAGQAMKACGSVTVYVQVFAQRGGDRSWQGYVAYIALPSYACPAGQKPGGGNVPGTGGGGGSGGGDPGPGPSPGPGDPSNPDPEDPDNPDPETPPEPPPGPDPEDPTPDPDPEPEPPPEVPDDFKASWGLDWDHGWARDLPKTL